VEAVELAVLEALADPRIAGAARQLAAPEIEAELHSLLPGTTWHSLEQQGLVEHWGDRIQLVVDGRSTLDELRCRREIEWATGTVTQGEVLAGFARHCADELEDVEVVEQAPSRLVLSSKKELGTLELRAGFLFCERLAGDGPILLLGELDDALVDRFLADEGLRSSVAVYDLARLQKVNAVRSGVFVYFEWFLREAYGVKLVPSDVFTQGLVDRGIISLGMG
jgi:hypothetical protein